MKIFKFVTVLLGGFFLYWIIHKFGWEELKNDFFLLRWRLLIPIVIIGVCHSLHTVVWKFFLKKFEHHDVSLWALFRIKMAGEAASMITPVNFFGGDSLRVWLLSHKVPVSMGAASIVVDRSLQILSIVMVIVLGNFMAFFEPALPPSVRWILGSSSLLLLVLVLLFLSHQAKGISQKVLHLIEKIKKKKFSPETYKKIVQVDTYLTRFYRQDKKVFIGSLMAYFLIRIFGVYEIIFLARSLEVPMSFRAGLLFGAVIPMTNFVSAIVPGALGVLEGVVATLFLSLGWSPAHALALQIARRFRSFIWIIIGFVFLLFFKRKTKEKSKI